MYYEEYLHSNSHQFIARNFKAVKAKAEILTKLLGVSAGPNRKLVQSVQCTVHRVYSKKG